MTAFAGVRLHVVSGKGGTGKTTVAASLALALAAGGRRVLVCEVEGRGGLAQVFDVPPLGYEERRLALAPGGGEVVGLAVDPEEALLEYLETFYKLRRAGSALRRIGAVDFATTIAPGMRDVLLTGKIMEAARRSGPDTKPAYDAVVLDAPPTGRVTRFLNVNAEVAGLAKAGPIHGHAQQVMSLIGSPQTAVHLVTLLEEMPVQETLDAVTELRAAGLRVGGLVVNMTRPPLVPAAELAGLAEGTTPHDHLVAGLQRAGLPADDVIVEGLLAEGRDHALRVGLEERERAELATAGLPVAELPLVTDAVDTAALFSLAGRLGRELLA